MLLLWVARVQETWGWGDTEAKMLVDYIPCRGTVGSPSGLTSHPAKSNAPSLLSQRKERQLGTAHGLPWTLSNQHHSILRGCGLSVYFCEAQRLITE